jgi:concanavalin A-like lectin/glucanase superfamily protein
MTFAAEIEPSVLAMTRLLTVPFRRGAETLEIPVSAAGAQGTALGPYTFDDYRARHGDLPPAPRYIVVSRQATGRDAAQIDVDYRVAAFNKTVTVTVPAHSFAGSSWMIPIPENEAATAALIRFRSRPVTIPGDQLGFVALLGNLAKLSWVLGWDKDELRQQLREVQRQRTTPNARSYSLDRLGEDLGVPRFPAREHSFDPGTIALYHFNDVVANGGAVADDTKRFGRPGHDGVNDTAESVPAGKFGGAFRFSGTGIKIASHADFNVAANRSLTVEAFIRPDATDDAAAHMIIARGTVSPDGELAAAGWTLSLGNDRGFAHNPRWAVRGAGQRVELFGDADLADGAFHHVAGVIDDATKQARLFVDGRERATAVIDQLGAVANAEPAFIGRSGAGHPFFGLIDEVRISSVARADFHPVIGEGDEAYRQRLGIFEQWLLPTPGALTDAINSRVQINGDPKSFMLVETPRAGAAAGAVVRIIPAHVAAGQQVTADGSTVTREPQASGLAAADEDFEPIFLLRHDRPAVDYLDEASRMMQAGTATTLDRLLELIAAVNPAVAGNLLVELAYAAEGPGLHAVGRALRMRHAALGTDRLAVLAHRAGFDFVRNDDPSVYASIGPGEKLAITIEPRPPLQTPPAPITVFLGQSIDVHALPETLPRVGTFQWSLVPLGPGAAHFAAHPADPAQMKLAVSARPRLRLVADAPGEMMLRVEYRHQRRVVTGTLRIRIDMDAVAGSITRDGDRNALESTVSGVLRVPVKPIYLVTSNAAGVNFGANANNQKMHVALQRTFDTLLRRNAGLAAGLTVVKAFDPNDPGLHAAGRAILLTHGAIASDRLAALAHHAGFDFVERRNAQVYASVADDNAIEIVRAAGLTPLEPELVAGTPVDLRARFDPLPGNGSFNWSAEEIGEGRGSFDFVLRPQVRFTPREPGLAALHVFFHEQDANAMLPYTFDVRLNPNLEAANAVVPKPQYDLVMNILNYFHPIGVEVLTGRLRKNVVEIEQDPLKAFPAYTYPHFRT